MESSELEPCPFCGKDVIIEPFGPFSYAIQCHNPSCPASEVFVDKKTETEAARAWNTRAGDMDD